MICKSKTEFLQTASYPIIHRTVTVKGPRGSLEKSFKHLAVDIYMVDKDTIKVLSLLVLVSDSLMIIHNSARY